MWYEVNYGQGWRINYAYSPNGINNWLVPYQTVIPVGTPDGFEMDESNPYVLYDDSAHLYKIWYTGASSNWALPIPDRFRLGYATSPDGTNWTKYGWVLKGTDGSWDAGGIARGESIIYKDGLYHMWYAATDTSVFRWRIGYATSPDGINWTRENNGLPVITPTEPWELSQVEYPNVIYNNGLYEMFYASSAGDVTTQLVYATSTDGINWTKPPDKNPLLTGTPNSYDGELMTGPSPMRMSDGTTLLWFSGNVSYILLASDGEFPPLETSTPTPSPTSTPTPTPTPIPQVPTKLVILIPGMTASWNFNDLFKCQDSNSQWSFMPFAPLVYNPLINSLKANDWKTSTFNYDWRKRVTDNAQRLKTFIDANVQAGEKVDVVAHSMGGLVARSYIEQEGAQNKIDKLITVGTPHKGAVDAYPAWSAGQAWGGDVMWRLYVTWVERKCAPKTNHNDREAIQQYAPSIQDTLPIFDYLIDNKTNQTKPVGSMNAQNTWLLSSIFKSPFNGTTVGTLSGNNEKTSLAFRVDAPNPQEANLGYWEDGKPVKTVTTKAGDNRVLTMSSTLPDANSQTMNGTHTDIISTKYAIGKILDFLDATNQIAAMMATQNVGNAQGSLDINTIPPKKHKDFDRFIKPYITPNSGLFIIAYHTKLWVMDPMGKFMKDTDGLVSYLNPKAGMYKLFMWHSEKDALIIVAQILPNNVNLWREYPINHRFPQIRTLWFDPKHPKEDILH